MTLSRGGLSEFGGIRDGPSHSGNMHGGQKNQQSRSFLDQRQKKDHPDYFQQQDEGKDSLWLDWGCISELSCLSCLQDHIFSKDIHVFFTSTMQRHILHTFQRRGRGIRRYGYWTGLQSWTSTSTICGKLNFEKWKYNDSTILLDTLRWLKCFISWYHECQNVCSKSANVFNVTTEQLK